MISNLISPTLLRSVRSEIQKLSFTPKETDIYKIHQSGDLANLDGLDDASLKLLPSLLTLRDAMYSSAFREYLSTITGSGPLSGKTTDMAINVYTPGCHLLCHDDVIGSRRVSYILYLTDPDKPWQKEWGGALRLYPTQTHTEEDGKVTKILSPDYSVSIPPAFNQLSFFAVQPGESFHDVEEVYAGTEAEGREKDDARVRMAISGWYHIPQEGEEGHVEGLEDKFAKKSSLMQLQGKPDDYDLPKPNPKVFTPGGAENGDNTEDPSLSEEDFNLLLKYLAPTYLTPDTVNSVAEIFGEECSLCLENFLSPIFAESIRHYIQTQESQILPDNSAKIDETAGWTVARPPHKHRFLFQEANFSEKEMSPLQDLLQNLFPSSAFQKWLALLTGHQIASHNLIARRFRRGQDYTLATRFDEDSPRVELCLGVTPTPGWGGDEAAGPEDITKGESGTSDKKDAKENDPATEDPGVGGYLAYMAGDDDDDHSVDDGVGSDHGVEVPLDMSTGARSTKATNPQKAKQDPAIYQASGDNEDDGVLFSMPAGWNRLGIVLRDKGTMRFVKYVSRMAKGDRWDLVGDFGIIEGSDSDEEGDEGVVGGLNVGNDADEDDDEGVVAGWKVINGADSNATTSIEEANDDDDDDDDNGEDEKSSDDTDD